MVKAFIVVLCLGFPSSALLSQQQEPPPETAPAKQPAPDNQAPSQPEKTPPAAGKSDTKSEPGNETRGNETKTSETKAEPDAAAKTEAPAQPGSQPSDQSNNQPKTESKKKESGGQPKNGTKGHANGKRESAPQAPAPDSGPRKIVVREGGAEEPVGRIVSGMTLEEASRERRNTEDLLNSTREILQRISERTLEARQQETVSQIQNYMEGSRSALKEGDIARGKTLALKAHLLADDLEKH